MEEIGSVLPSSSGISRSPCCSAAAQSDPDQPALPKSDYAVGLGKSR
jgi:hypothetical protein